MDSGHSVLMRRVPLFSPKKTLLSLLLTISILHSSLTSAPPLFSRLAVSAQSINPNLVKCSGNKWFDTTQFSCRDCPQNQEPDSEGRACQCRPGFVKSKRSLVGDSACTQCPAGQMPSQDATFCIKCDAASMELTVGGNGGQCKCK